MFEKIVDYIEENHEGKIDAERPFVFLNFEKYMLAKASDEDGGGLELYNMETEKY